MAPSVLARFLTWHRLQLNVHPYLTNSATSAVLMCCGDRFAQFMEDRDQPKRGSYALTRHSLARTTILTTWAALASCLWTRYYFFIFQRWPGRILLWTGLTALVPAPIMNAAFFAGTTFAEHLALHERPLETLDDCAALVRHKIEVQFLPTVARSAMLWIPFNLINFRFVPLEYRMMAGSAVSFGWNAYLSIIQHTHSHAPIVEAPPP